MSDANSPHYAAKVIAIPIVMVVLSIAICGASMFLNDGGAGDWLMMFGVALFFFSWLVGAILFVWERGKRVHPRSG